MLNGKTALVTGATSGIGAATVRALRALGATVLATGRRAEGALRADLSRLDDLDALMREVQTAVGHLDILVVNAGVSHAPDLADLSLATYDALMNVNVRGAVFTFVRALPLLADGASVVFVGSVAGRKGQPGDALYAGSKGFIRAFVRNAGTDPKLLARRIRVNVVAPGPTDTELTKDAVSDAHVSAYVESLVPMHRWGRASEVANAITFLASDQSSFTTGAELTVDGGMAHA
jgi:NAD(P)-dependent dehydrogenase (short-subunit alcohol dehydrogenase family)